MALPGRRKTLHVGAGPGSGLAIKDPVHVPLSSSPCLNRTKSVRLSVCTTIKEGQPEGTLQIVGTRCPFDLFFPVCGCVRRHDDSQLATGKQGQKVCRFRVQMIDSGTVAPWMRVR